MLYIHYRMSCIDPHLAEQHGLDTGLKEKEWHVGDAAPSEQLDDDGIEILTIMADGYELDHIIASFNNIPYTALNDIKRRKCVWRGDLARFIFDNL